MPRLLAILLSLLLASPSFAAIALVADGGYGTSAVSGTSASLTMPTGTVQNNLEIMCATVTTSVAQGTLTTPTGWTLITSTGSLVNASARYLNTYAFYKVAGVSESGPYTVSYNTGGTIFGVDGDIRTYSGTATSSPINSFATIVDALNNGTVIIPALSETFVPGEEYVACSPSPGNDNPTGSSPTITDVYANAGFINAITLGDLVPGSAPGAETITYSANITGRPAWGLTILPLSGGATPCKAGSLLLQGAGC